MKRLDLFGWKGYSSATLQFWITNYEAIMAKYDYTNCNKFKSFLEHLPKEHREHMQAIIKEGPLLAKTSVQASLDAADAAARFISGAVVMHKVSRLQFLGFPREIQVEDLQFDGQMLFSGTMDKFLHMLKDSRATLRCLGIYTPTNKRRFSKS